MQRVIDYWRGLVADLAEAESNSPEDLRAVGDLWYPVMRMRILSAVHDSAERKLGPCDLPADHAEQVARRVWNDLVSAMHKRAMPEMWPEYAAVITTLRPWLAARFGVDTAKVASRLEKSSSAELMDIADVAYNALYPEPLPSRDEHVARGAISAFLFSGRAWPDLGTWAPFTLYSITARYFEQGHYLGPKLCSSESEILDLVEFAPYGADWARSVVSRRAQTRTVVSYLRVLNTILKREPLPQDASLVSRRLTLVEWLSDPEARLARMVAVQGAEVSDGVVWRAFRGEERRVMLDVLRAATGEAKYPAGLPEAQRRAALERLVEAMEALALRTELVVTVTERNGKRGVEWASAVVGARAPKAFKSLQLGLLAAISSRKEIASSAGPVKRNRTLRSLYRTLEIAASPGAGVTLLAAGPPAFAQGE